MNPLIPPRVNRSAVTALLLLPCPLMFTARAAVAEFQAAAASNPSLMHQYTFDGSDEAERRADKKGRAHLSLQLVGTGLESDLEYGVSGFDLTSAAVKTTRGPGTDNANGAYLRTPAVTFGQSVAFEAIFQPSEAEISGGQFNLAYILSTRVDNDRGYFLTQGGPLPSMGLQLASSIGNGHNDSNTNTILPGFTVGNWYYVSGSYQVGQGNVTWTNYVADLTAGQTVLTQVGPFTNSGGTYPLVSTPLGIGGRWDAQESFPGLIDEINFYDAEVSGADFQKHLGLLTGASLALKVEANGSDLIFRWESRDGKRYNLRSETGLATEPATWPIFDGHADLMPTASASTLTIPRPADPERYFVIEEFNPPPVVVFSDDFEMGPGAWTTGSDGEAGTAWELGPPANAGPPSARSPANCFGTNLDGDYEVGADVWLRSPPIDLTTAESATLKYFQYQDIEEGFDFGRVVVRDDSNNAELVVVEDMIDGITADWQQVSKPLPAEALGKRIKIEFRFQSDDISNFAGWYVDDVEVTLP